MDLEVNDNLLAQAVASNATSRRWICKFGCLSVVQSNYKHTKHLLDDYKQMLKHHKEVMKGKVI